MQDVGSLWRYALLGLFFSNLADAAEPFRLCTGSPGKTYFAVGNKLQEMAPGLSGGQLAIEVVPTQGSIDNLNRIVQGECQGAIVQGDAVVFFTGNVMKDSADRFRLLGALYKELSLLICSRDSGIGEIEALPGKKGATIAAGPMGSGSLATWLTFRAIKPDYAKVKVLPENGAAGALAVARGDADCLLEVIAPQSDFLESLNGNREISRHLTFAEVDDDFDGYQVDGQIIYTEVEFDDERYPNISTWGDPELLAINAYLVVGEQWAQTHPAELNSLSMLLLVGQPDIEAVAYGDRKPFED